LRNFSARNFLSGAKCDVQSEGQGKILVRHREGKDKKSAGALDPRQIPKFARCTERRQYDDCAAVQIASSQLERGTKSSRVIRTAAALTCGATLERA
jgi:hypothetical protein